MNLGISPTTGVMNMAIKVNDLMKLAASAEFDAAEFSEAKRAGKPATDYGPLLAQIKEKGFIVLPAVAWKKCGASVQKFAKRAGTPITGTTGKSGELVRLTFKPKAADENKEPDF